MNFCPRKKNNKPKKTNKKSYEPLNTPLLVVFALFALSWAFFGWYVFDSTEFIPLFLVMGVTHFWVVYLCFKAFNLYPIGLIDQLVIIALDSKEGGLK